MRTGASLYIGAVCLAGIAMVTSQAGQWPSHDLVRFLCYLAIAVVSSGLKVSLPGVTGNMPVTFLFILIGILDMSLAETLAIGCIGTLAQFTWRQKAGFKLIQTGFSVANTAISVYVCYGLYHWHFAEMLERTPVLLILIAVLFFAVNTGGVALFISVTEGSPLSEVWRGRYFRTLPFYLLGASVAWIVSVLSRQVQWHSAILLLPILFFIYRANRHYLGRLEVGQKHVDDMAALHLRTIEALALAIEAKDHNTHEHLRRVRTYAVEIGREMGLGNAELEALRAATLLHDIGKLAVPEHIISKPGKLTPEEFEKIKIHPIVGAEILERVQFPYPVVPIVRAHHEKWDGTGYPAGLKGEEIPLGARILSAVDCLDALASYRPYRPALPLNEAMDQVVKLAGKSYDPAVVAILERRYVELEQLAKLQPFQKATLSTDVKIEKGESPEAGFETPRKIDFQTSIAAARLEAQLLFELTRDLGNSLSLDETFSVVETRLKRMVPYDALAVYISKNGRLVPEYVKGENLRLFSSLAIPVGEGLSGWVAENKKAILNGNPSVESGYLNDPTQFSTLRSGLAVPLQGVDGIIGVLTLYRAAKDAFSQDDLRVLLAVSLKISQSVENALRFRQAENSATTDYLTGLANTRSLFLRLDSEISRCHRMNQPLTVLVCDLDGFKKINDRYGHMEGNKVLRRVADALRENCREYDYVARLGGDEFVLLLPGTDREVMQQRITELKNIAGAAGKVTGSEPLLMSVGEACYPHDGTDAEQLLSVADQRMYQAKQEGEDAESNLAVAG